MPAARGGLFVKYIVVLGLLVTGALVASGIVHGYFALSESQAALARIQRAEARTAATRITEFIDEVERQVGSVALSPRPGGSLAAEQRRLDYLRLLRLQPAVGEIAYVDAAGHEQLRVSPASPTVIGGGADRSGDPSVEAARSATTYRGPVYFRRDSEPFMTLAMREIGPDPGVTVAEINLTLIWEVVSRIGVGNAGYAYVVDSRGQLLAHPNLSLVLRRTDASHVAPVYAAIGARVPGADPVTVAPDLEGQNVLSVWEPVPPTDWLIVANQPLDEALAPIYAVVWRTAVLVILGIGLSLVASVALARRMVAPIRTLQQGAARIGAGNLDQPIEVHSGDELESLAGELNRMSARLQASYSGLEQSVEQRTRELAQAVSALEEQSRQLAIASRHKSEFLTTMSHELRTPLNAIIGFGEILIEGHSIARDPRESRYLSNILVAGRHLLALINEILDLAKIEAGAMEIEVRRFSLSEVVEHSVIWIQEYAARHRLEVTLDIDPRLGMVEGDERKIKQVLANLLSNAVKFTPDGGCVEVCVRRVSDEAHVTVRDTGIGIAASDQDRIFSPFEQGSGRMPAYNEGTGLGLAISRRLVELHGGRIWVESTPGVGSSFTFAIPLGQPSREAVVPPTAQQHEEPGADTLDHWHAPPPLQPPGSPATGISTAVLVIDNHPMAIEVVEAVLAPEGYRVISSLGGEAGLDLAGRERPNLIILDLIMPDLDGFTVVRKLRENPGTAGIPVIVLTSKALSTEERAQLAGQVSHLGQKGDFDRAAFVELVRRHTSR